MRPVMQALIGEAKAEGLPEKRACQVLRISPRSLQRWRRPVQPKASAALRPRPVNALTRDEAATVVSLIRSAEHADQSCRELALSLATGSAMALSVSPVTVWRYQVALGCAGPRGRQVSQRHGPAPDTDWVTGPNQLWDWDVTLLRSSERWIFWYLYSLLDHFSRKNIAWQVQDRLSSDHVQQLWDQGLTHEGLLDRPRAAWPKSLSDRGAPMRSHSTRHYFMKLGIAQSFSRPRTPNDNPRIEAHFGTVKTHPVYPGWFSDVPAAVTYFTGFYDWYNNIHRLTTLKMLTPHQVHAGQTATLLAERRDRQSQAFIRRRDACHTPFTLEELIAQPLPDVSQYPVYTWAGPDAVPQTRRHLLRN